MARPEFDATVQTLADPGGAWSASDLTHLSMMGPEEASLFMDAWYGMEERRRGRLVTELLELAEDNVELDFDAVFFIALADADAAVRRDAIRGLWEHEGRELIDPLIGMLETDPDAGVRAEAGLALGRFVVQAEFDNVPPGDAARIDVALRRTFDDASEVSEVRARALESLGARSREWVRDRIQDAFDGDDRRLRLSAVHAMGRSCDAEWLPSIIPELESDDPEMRFEAAGAAGEIADEDATPHLVPLLHDEDAEVQQAAVNALGEIGGEAAKEALEALLPDADDRIRELVLDALAEVEFAEDPLSLRIRG